MTPISATGRSNSAATSRPCPSRPLDCGPFDGTAPSCLRPAASTGFSLLEVLVVVFIIGVLATMFTLSVGVTGGDRQLDTEVDRLIAVVGLAREEAVIQGREIGLRFFTHSYEFSAYYEDFVDYHDEDNPDQSEWALLDRETLLGPRQLSDGLVFEIRIDGREIVLKDPEDEPPADVTEEDDEESPKQVYEPQVMIFSSGDMSPFTIQIRRAFANTGTTIEFNIDGTAEIEEARE